MKVNLIARTPHALRLVGAAARGCYSDKSSWDLYRDMEEEDYVKLVKQVINSGHMSVLEHINFTFSIAGVSRACTHQLVRHRLASYSQQSQRYVEFSREDESGLINDDLFVVPPIMNVGLRADYLIACDDALINYEYFVQKLKDNGRTDEQAQEDARYLLPNAAKTNITVTMNARELYHFFALRTCKRAQWEIRELAVEMLQICEHYEPELFFKAGAACMHDSCGEGKHSCGEPY